MSFTKAERLEIRDLLIKHGVANTRCDYSGYGDSGDFHDPDFFDAQGKDITGTLKDVVISTPYPPTTAWVNGSYQTVQPEGFVPLTQAVYDLFYEMLEGEHPGWEINEGADGEFNWAPADAIEWTHNSHYTETSTTSQSLSIEDGDDD